MPATWDLHLHSLFSDGDLAPEALVAAVQERHLAGLSITDHNCLGASERGRQAAAQLGLDYLEGIEISARSGDVDIHILGYSQKFDFARLNKGLLATRQGYEERVAAMVARCQAAGYSQVSFEAIVDRRQALGDSVPVSFDVARELQERHNVPLPRAHAMTVKGGECYVPYGEWALSPADAIGVVHEAGGVAVLAHGGIIVHEGSQSRADEIVTAATAAGLDGVEVYHPFHSQRVRAWLLQWAASSDLLITGGSDWHSAHRFPDSNRQFGSIGITADQWQRLIARCKSLHT